MTNTFDAYDACELCPRRCGARRTSGQAGLCGCADKPRVARAALHYWEEPPISGEVGSGAIFFGGCPLRCVFCQNHQISQGAVGIEVGSEQIARMMLDLQGQGALNINLVTPLHHAPHIRKSVELARAGGLSIPVVCNTSGYELAHTVHALGDVIDVWLTDFKYRSSALAKEFSHAQDYPEVACEALVAMMDEVNRQGGRSVASDESLRRGVIVRHLVLPGHVEDSCAVLDLVWELCGNDADLSVMNQYTPNERCRRAGGELARGVTDEEYEIVLCHADDLGFERIWWQQGGTVSESFVPAFDGTGVA